MQVVYRKVMNSEKRRSSRPQSGFTLIELVVVVGVIMTVLGLSLFNVIPALRNGRIERAYQTTLMQVRRARQSAVDDRRVYIANFVLPRTIRIDRVEPDATVSLISQIDLPDDVSFLAEPGIPSNPLETPDGFGTGAVAADFNGETRIFFQPDGSAEDTLGRISNGVLYIARPGDILSSRAVSVFGATGRIKGWKLFEQGGGTFRWR